MDRVSRLSRVEEMGAEKEKRYPKTSGSGESTHPGGPRHSDSRGRVCVSGESLGDIRGGGWQDTGFQIPYPVLRSQPSAPFWLLFLGCQ